MMPLEKQSFGFNRSARTITLNDHTDGPSQDPSTDGEEGPFGPLSVVRLRGNRVNVRVNRSVVLRSPMKVIGRSAGFSLEPNVQLEKQRGSIE